MSDFECAHIGMRFGIIGATAIMLVTCHAAQHQFYIGTRSVRDSKGIYSATFNDATGELSGLMLAATYKDPGFLCPHPQKSLLYSIGARQDGTGTLAVFAIANDGTLNLLADVPSGGKGPCHLAMDEQAKSIAVANYGCGSTASFLLDENGIPSEAVSSMRVEGHSVHPKRQTSPHAHGVYFADGHCFVPDLGLDKILVYQHDVVTAALRPADPPHASTTAGDGPRHLAFHPQKPWVYCVNELSNTVTHFVRDGHKLEKKESISTLPVDFKEPNATAEIEIHSNGRFLYASNRGHDSIAAYQIDPASGALTAMGQTVAEVKNPRHFTIAPGGAYLIVAGQDSDNLQVLSIDPQSGKLTPTAHKLQVPSPICLVFSRR